jgi:hypothetical protein
MTSMGFGHCTAGFGHCTTTAMGIAREEEIYTGIVSLGDSRMTTKQKLEQRRKKDRKAIEALTKPKKLFGGGVEI